MAQILMCPPDYYGIEYEINPWMDRKRGADRERAIAQWQALYATLTGPVGAKVELLDPEPGLPDMVFTANAGLVAGKRFIPSRFRHSVRTGEEPHFHRWFESHGYAVDELPEGVSHEGAGDALPFGGVLVSAYRFRSDAASHAYLSRLTGAAVRSVELVDERFYHLDLTFCPLDDHRALVYPGGWDSYGQRVMKALVPEPLELTTDEALSFCANSVAVGRTVVMPSVPPRVGRQLEAWGFTVAECPVDEFLKAGGGCRCLTLALDVALS